ncbi:uncharacterized protein LOC143247470 [Tachypleus tridentatus]|uniref:uncharacterized protein LOC143247470 n=1 Tax=Tachypleus tridentatus TaxID=6853 RepID=UPI003FD1EFCA
MAPAVQAPVDKPQEEDVSVSEGPSHINFFVADDSNNSSGSDDEEPAQNGYELLPQDIGENGIDHSLHREEEQIDENVETSGTIPYYQEEDEEIIQNPLISSHSTETTNASLSSERNSSTTMVEPGESSNSPPMDKDHIEKIKECMSGFTLPSSSVPSWASVIPEEDWKKYLLGRLEERKLDLKTFSQNEVNSTKDSS